jgi:hypothetical protein
VASDYTIGSGGARAATTRRITIRGTAVVVLLCAVAVGTGLVGSTGASIAAGVIAAVLGLVLYAVVYARRATDRLVLLSEHVTELRPRAAVIPALADVEMRAIARSLGSTTSGWSTVGGSPTVVSVGEHRVEVWNGRNEPAPRWSVDRARARISERSITVGGTPWPGIQVSDGLHRIVVAPRYGSVSALSARTAEFVQRALGELGAEDTASGPRPVDEDWVSRWHPQMTRELLRGPSARWWERAFVSLLALTGLLFVVVSAAFFVPGEPSWGLPAVFAFLTCAAFVGRAPFSPVLWIADRRVAAEYAAGYATSTTAWFDVDAPVDVIDPRSGRVIRPAGEPADADRSTQKQLLTERVRRSRDAARGHVSADR